MYAQCRRLDSNSLRITHDSVVARQTTEGSERHALFLTGAAVFAFTLYIRVQGISTHLWLLGDQIRDWSIALRPFGDLPLVGPATHVGGYTIGPAYYWIMWGIRVVVGPWFDNLPHAGGIGQAIIESGADVLLLTAVWRRTRSAWGALAAIVVISTAAFDVALSAIVWTTTVASALGKMAIALVLLDWHRRGVARVALIAALAWSAVQVYTGAVFVTVSVFAALLMDPIAHRNWAGVRRSVAAIAAVVGMLQVPYLIHQIQNRFGDRAMSHVTEGVWRILSRSDAPEVWKSLNGYAAAFNFIEVAPWQTTIPLWVLAVSALVVAIRYRRDPVLPVLTILPQVTAIAGYALFLGPLDHYYYISVMPAAVLTVFLAVAVPSYTTTGRVVGIAIFVAALAIVPARLRLAATMNKLPEYQTLVEGSRNIVRTGQPMRAISAAFPLPPTSDPEFLFTVLGGRIQRDARWFALIGVDGDVTYGKVED